MSTPPTSSVATAKTSTEPSDPIKPVIRASVRPPDAEAARQQRVLSVYILVRLLIGLGLLALSLRTLMEQPSVREELSGPFALAALMFLAMGLSAAAVRRYARATWFTWTQVTIDGLFASTLVFMTGGPVSPLFPLFFLNVIAATFVLLRMTPY